MMKTQIKSLRAAVCICAILTFVAQSKFQNALSADSEIIIRGPYLQLPTTNSIWIVWRTDCKRIYPLVRYGKDKANLDLATDPKNILIKFSPGNSNIQPHKVIELYTKENLKLPRLHTNTVGGIFQYEAKITGLEPDTRYYYAVYDGDIRLTPSDDSYSFRTPPHCGTQKPIRFWVVGDSGTARKMQYLVYKSAFRQAQKEGKMFDFIIHVGDIAYMNGKDMEFQTRHFNMYAEALRNLVCWTTLGNHEGYSCKSDKGIGPYYDAHILPTKGEAGGVPSGTESYYSFDWGRVHFICLDSFDMNRKTNAPMAQWLKKDLEKTKKDGKSDWIVAFFHHPAYTMGSHDGIKEKEMLEMRRYIMPILEQGGVDVVFTGHSHTYERTMLIQGAYDTNYSASYKIIDDGDGNPEGDGAYIKSKGINPNEGHVHVVTGHGGTTLGRKGTLPYAKFTYIGHGSTIVDVSNNLLTVTMIDAYGSLIDRFCIEKRDRVTVAGRPNPWQPQEFKRFAEPNEDGFPVMPPMKYTEIIPQNAQWTYLYGKHPNGIDWTWLNYKPTGWKVGIAPFGRAYPNVHTQIQSDGRSTVIYLRKEFVIERPDKITELALMADCDDGFIVYLNGYEVGRKNIERGSGKHVQNVKQHYAGETYYVPLRDFYKYIKKGVNVLAIEAHNSSETSQRFYINPYLIAED
ncbi:MAG: metallophosphoesterase [Verrucomicrobiia bacterium]|jgi:hypothetical protein